MSYNAGRIKNNKPENGVYIKASATVEASLVIPLYVYAVLAVAYVIQIFWIKTDINIALYNAIRQQNRYDYMINAGQKNIGEIFIDSTAVYSLLIKNLGTDYAKKHYINGGNSGIKVICSNESDSTKEVKIHYSVKNPFDIFNIGCINVSQTFTSAVWLGEKYAKDIGDNAKDVVFITASGTVFHEKRNCRALDIDVRQADIKLIKNYRNAAGAIYYPCEVCMQKNDDDFYGNVYITEYGIRYHSDIECSKLKRSVIEIPRKNAAGMRACKICAE